MTPKQFCKKNRANITFKIYSDPKLIHLLINFKNKGNRYDVEDLTILQRGLRGNLHLEFGVKFHFLKKYGTSIKTPENYYFD